MVQQVDIIFLEVEIHPKSLFISNLVAGVEISTTKKLLILVMKGQCLALERWDLLQQVLQLFHKEFYRIINKITLETGKKRI